MKLEDQKRIKTILVKAYESIVALEEAITSALNKIKEHERPDLVYRLNQYLDVCHNQEQLILDLQDEFLTGEELNMEAINSGLNRFYGLSNMIRTDSKQILESLVLNIPLQKVDENKIN